MTNSEVIGMLKQMQKKTAKTKGFFIGHVTHAWVINDLSIGIITVSTLFSAQEL